MLIQFNLCIHLYLISICASFVLLPGHQGKEKTYRSIFLAPGNPFISSLKTVNLEKNQMETNETPLKRKEYNSLEQLLRPSQTCDVNQISPTSLAYIGDSVFELFIRSRYVWPNRRTSDLQQKVVGVVRAESQSQLLSKMMESINLILTPKELTILNRGRNAGGSGSRKKNKGPKRFFSEDKSNAGGATVYQDATALETLVGYLFIEDSDRCFEILNWIKTELDEKDATI